MSRKIKPRCPVFGACGGCSYQDLPYIEELAVKKAGLRKILTESGVLKRTVFEEVVASPKPYHYRSRLDLTLKRNRQRGVEIGFQPQDGRRLIPVASCAIARKEISDFIPELKRQAVAKLPDDYQVANLVVKTGSDRRVLWGGIGRRSLVLPEADYLWVKIQGKKIFYSLDTFFQANLSILSQAVQKLREILKPDERTHFFDLYSGVGLFGILMASDAAKVFMIEECESSIELARFNAAYHELKNVEIRHGKVETELPLIPVERKIRRVGFVDPPRKGLTPAALKFLSAAKNFESLIYLSCSPESLARDLVIFRKKGWKVRRVVPFDFFPKTRHLETMVLLKK